MKLSAEPIVMVTAYDHPSAQVVEAAGVDVVLVGDSAAMTVLGYDSTVPVGIDEMVMLASAVRRGLETPLLVGDLPFGSYERSNEQAIDSAMRFVKEAGCDAVKLERGGSSVDRARAIVRAGIPVMGHVGLTPQTATALGGFKARGKTAGQASTIAEEALALQAAGCFAIVFEAIPAAITEALMPKMTIPVIGIGAGPGTDGQVLVYHDLLGIFGGHAAKFVKRFAEVREEMIRGVGAYAAEVREGSFPGARARVRGRRGRGRRRSSATWRRSRPPRASSAATGRRPRSSRSARGARPVAQPIREWSAAQPAPVARGARSGPLRPGLRARRLRRRRGRAPRRRADPRRRRARPDARSTSSSTAAPPAPTPSTGDGAGILIALPHEFLAARAGEFGVDAIPERRARRRRDVLPAAPTPSARPRSSRRSSAPSPSTARGRSAGATSRSTPSTPAAPSLAVAPRLPPADDRRRRRDRRPGRVRAAPVRDPPARRARGRRPTSTSPASPRGRIVYKGMLTAPQLADYFPDLRDPELRSALAVVHSRFSTNTFPSWELAHPHRIIAHNGEINTLLGNLAWMRAREARSALRRRSARTSALPAADGGRDLRLGRVRPRARAAARLGPLARRTR